MPSSYKSCWISSIVRLPNLYLPTDTINGLQVTSGTDDEGNINSDYNQYIGRSLCNMSNVHKYKLEFTTLSIDGRTHLVEIVGLSNIPFDSRSILSPDVNEGLFFPIYLKSGENCFLFISSINDLFKEPGCILKSDFEKTGVVMSTSSLIGNVMDKVVWGGYGYGQPNKIDNSGFSPINRTDSIQELIYCAMTESNLDDFYIKYEQPLESIPTQFTEFAKVRTVGHMKHFLSPYGCVPSDIAARCMFICNNSDMINNLSYTLHSKNAIPNECADVSYVGDDEIGITSKWLTGLFEADVSDLEFALPISCISQVQVADLYARTTDVNFDFHKSWELMRHSKDYLYYLTTGFALFKYGKPQLLVNRSWLEDLTIKDPDTNEILLYIDLVFWILACAGGLVNASVLDYIKLY